ncbi:Hypothetical_protein [Hexamita inflata]|uniref:Hypothetical_protein n=1 Tax=Hexamita inflata TaxID=28002 RepID=A0AA86UGT7_9EUKA|nr:Hypothetical protein HINF_LOCUS45225 [Hexamita inflata]
MPFIFEVNENKLLINWTDEILAQTVQMQDFKDQYYSIIIKGQNYQEFENYEFLSQSKYLEISGCSVNLSNIKGRIKTFCLDNCKCTNDFTSECQIKSQIQTLSIKDSNVQVQQLRQLKQLVYFDVSIQSSEYVFDFINCYMLNCQLTLTLTDQYFNLSQLNGKWLQFFFTNCIFTGEVDSTLKVHSVSLKISKESNINNIKHLQNLECDKFEVYNSSQNSDHVFDVSTYTDGKKKVMEVYLRQCVLDLSSIQGSWDIMKLINCSVVGNLNFKSNTKFIEIQIDDECKMDFGKFCGKNTVKNITLNNHQQYNFDLELIQKCQPKELTLQNYNLDLTKIIGKWEDLAIISCQFTKYSAPNSIQASQIQYNNNQYIQSLNCFQSTNFNIHRLQYSPFTTNLTIIQTPVNITEKNQTIQYLSLLDVKYVKFSVINLINLTSMDFKNIQTYNSAFSTKEASMNYLRLKKKIKSVKNQHKQRVLQILKLQKQKIISVNTLTNYYNSFFDLNLLKSFE